MKINSINSIFLNSPWPFILTINIIRISINLIININKTIIWKLNLIIIITITSLILWFNNSIKEKIIIGIKRKYNEIRIKTIIYIIIITERIFFITFFYINFSISYFNNYIFNFKFNLRIFKLNFILSFTNLIILLISRITIIISININIKKNNNTIKYLKITVILGIYFISIQMIEYSILNFNISNSIFFSNFFILTIFHISHVLIGTIIIIYIIIKKSSILISNKTKIKILCWYWHFVDLIWIIIFVIIYTK